MINDAGKRLILYFESFRGTAYLDSGGVPTIGFGSTYGLDGQHITLSHPKISRSQAEYLFLRDVEATEATVRLLTHVPATDNEIAALTSLAYNIGTGNYRASTVRRMLNRGDYEGAADNFWQWRRAGGIILAGLVRRRAAEKALFLACNYPQSS